MIHTNPEPGDIGLTNVQGPIGRLIALGEFLNGDGFGRYQHAFIVLPGSRLIEAQPGGARVEPLDKYADREVLYVCPTGLTAAQRTAICLNAYRYQGVPYSFLDYAALAAHRFHLPVPGLRRFIADGGHLICSQLCDRAYLASGVHLFGDGRWPGYVTPMALYDLLAEGQQ